MRWTTNQNHHPHTHQFSLLKPCQTSHWFLITPSWFAYQFKRGDPPMAGDTWQILQWHLLHPLVAQALEGRQLVLGAERRFTREVWVTVKSVYPSRWRCFQHRGGYYYHWCWNFLDAFSLHHQGGDACSIISFIGLTWRTLLPWIIPKELTHFPVSRGYYPEIEKCVVYPIPCLSSYS